MTETKLTFQRYEKKYLLKRDQYESFMDELSGYVKPDAYFESLVMSVYYDSNTFDLIRASIAKPAYKEKLRLRSYGIPGENSTVFVELKKKYAGIVYKRRVELPQAQAEAWLQTGSLDADGQVIREVNWMLRSRGPLYPQAVICCDRRAYVGVENEELRITFDRSIRWRDDELSLTHGDSGRELLQNGEVLMEIKMPGSAPLWLADMLSRHGIFPTGFSKYGTCYTKNLIDKTFTGVVKSC